MADGFASIGKTLATPRYYFTMFIVGIAIIFVIYMLNKSPPSGESRTKQIATGLGIIAFALFVGFIANRWRSAVKSNDRYARIAGMGYLFRMFK